MRWWPRTLIGRLTLIIIGGLLASQLLGGLIYLNERRTIVERRVSQEVAQRIAAAYRALDSQQGAQREQLSRLLSTPRQQLVLAANLPSTDSSAPNPHALPTRLRELLGPDLVMRVLTLPSLSELRFAVDLRLADGGWVRVHGSAPEEIYASRLPLLLNLGIMLSTVFLLIWVAARTAVRPLTVLARAAGKLGEDLNQPPLPDSGPAEVREAALAFNAMQARIRQGIEERERFLAAVSHDLKTPVTRLRLRAEMLTDGRVRERMLHDLHEVQDMLDEAVDYLRGKLVEEPVQPIELAAMIESLGEDFRAAGWSVDVAGPDALRFDGRPKALRRAVSNLIDNAVKYGHEARVAVARLDSVVRIVVDDAGPGLAESELDRVFEPFYRVEDSRSRVTGGTGLGLAIVRQIARSHRGEVRLENRKSGGLRAVMELPFEGSPSRPAFPR